MVQARQTKKTVVMDAPKGPDGKRLLNATELEELREKYVESKLDPKVIEHVSEAQHVFFLYPHDMQMFNIKPDKKNESE